MVAAGDVLLAGAMLALFTIPLNLHIAQLRKETVTPVSASSGIALRHVIYFNLLVSTGVTICGLVSLISLTIGLSVDNDPRVMVWVGWGSSVELALTVIGTHSITNAWLPSRVRVALTRCKARACLARTQPVSSNAAVGDQVVRPPPSTLTLSSNKYDANQAQRTVS